MEIGDIVSVGGKPIGIMTDKSLGFEVMGTGLCTGLELIIGSAPHTHSLSGADDFGDTNKAIDEGWRELMAACSGQITYEINYEPAFENEGEPKMSRRVVQLFVYDPDERVPDDCALIYVTGEDDPTVTSISDSDLWIAHGEELMSQLAEHNRFRTHHCDREESRVRGRDVFLPPITLADVVKKIVVIA